MKNNIYKLDNIDCAACALKLEDKLNKLDGVSYCSLNYMFLRVIVEFDEAIVNDEDIELCIHKSLSGVRIVEKNNQEYIDAYEEPFVFKKIPFFGRRNKKL